LNDEKKDEPEPAVALSSLTARLEGEAGKIQIFVRNRRLTTRFCVILIIYSHCKKMEKKKVDVPFNFQ